MGLRYCVCVCLRKGGGRKKRATPLNILTMTRLSKFLMVVLVCYFAFKFYKADNKLNSGQIGTSFKRKNEKTVRVILSNEKWQQRTFQGRYLYLTNFSTHQLQFVYIGRDIGTIIFTNGPLPGLI